MAYRLRITDLALTDLDAIIEESRVRSAPSVAAEWLDGLARAVATLAERPIGEASPEGMETDFSPLQIAYRSHRVLFTVGEAAIDVLRIYPGAGQSLTLNLLRGGGRLA